MRITSRTGERLSRKRVEHLQDQVGTDDQEKAPIEQIRPDERAEAHDSPEQQCLRHGHRAGRDGARSLTGMMAVFLAVIDIVEHVRGAAGEAQARKAEHNQQHGVRVIEFPRKDNAGEDKDVLDPLMRSQ